MSKEQLVSLGMCCVMVATMGCAVDLDHGRLNIENDVAGLLGEGSDRYYTNGLKLELSGTDDPLEPGLGASTRRAFRDTLDNLYLWAAPTGSSHERIVERVVVGVGQQIYTPEDLSRTDIITEDRPYAGYLYAYGMLQNVAWSYEGEIDNRIDRVDSVELQLGVIGPSSLADDTQTQFHEAIGAKDPRGWDNQLEDEAAVQLSMSRHTRHGYDAQTGSPLPFDLASAYDLISNYGVHVGTVHINAQIGALARFSITRDLPRDFPSSTYTPGVPAEGKGGVYSYLFAGVDGRFVFRNTFLDGNYSRANRHDVSSEFFVADFRLGLVIGGDSLEFNVTQYARTPEFRRTSDPQLFTAAQIGWRF